MASRLREMADFDFVTIDFETANRMYNSACSVGIAAVSNGEIVKTFYSLIKPEGEFLPQNIAVHGITPEDVRDAPQFDDAFLQIRPYLGPYAVIAHNVRFDMSVLKKSIENMSMYLTPDEIPNFKYMDTMSLCKAFVQGSKSLENCVNELNIPMLNHHNALDDAIMCAKITLECIRRSGMRNLGSLCFALENVKIHSFSDLQTGNSYQMKSGKESETSGNISDKTEKSVSPNKQYEHVPYAQIRKEVACKYPDSPLYSKRLVFTGDLSISREIATIMAAECGAIVTGAISGKTDYLVIGTHDKSRVGADGISSKERKAQEMNLDGRARIKCIDEKTFIRLVKGKDGDFS